MKRSFSISIRRPGLAGAVSLICTEDSWRGKTANDRLKAGLRLLESRLQPAACLLGLAALAWSPAPLNADVLVSQNLGAAAYSASSNWEGETLPAYAFDGNLASGWNAADYAVQWLEVDLQQAYALTRFSLHIGQLPDGFTTHEIWVSNSPIQDDRSGATLLHTFSGFTVDLETLNHTLAAPVSAQFVQIHTTESPSWVSWVEVQAFAVPEPPTLALAAVGVLGLMACGAARMHPPMTQMDAD